MPEVFEGDEWKHAEESQDHFAGKTIATRAQQQAFIDRPYMERRMTLEDWRTQTELLSDGIY